LNSSPAIARDHQTASDHPLIAFDFICTSTPAACSFASAPASMLAKSQRARVQNGAVESTRTGDTVTVCLNDTAIELGSRRTESASCVTVNGFMHLPRRYRNTHTTT